MVRVGKLEAATVQDWVPEPGKLVSWQPSPATLTKASQAPISTVPPSYMQVQHLRNYRAYAAQDLEKSPLVITAWDIPGRCDNPCHDATSLIPTCVATTATAAVRAELGGEHFVRRTIEKPRDIQFVATQARRMTTLAEWRSHLLAMPSPLVWDCFRFINHSACRPLHILRDYRSPPLRRHGHRRDIRRDPYDVHGAGQRRCATAATRPGQL